MGRNVVDFITAPTLQQLRDADVDAVPYCDAARPSQDWINTVRADGRLPSFIYESVSTWSQGGDATAGTCTTHEAHIKATGHTGSVMVVVSDGSAHDPNYGYDQIVATGKHWSDEATMPFYPYGNVYCCEAFIAGARTGAGAHLLVKGIGGGPDAMIPETWGFGGIASQLVGGSPIPNTDLDVVHIDDLSGGPAPAPAAPDLYTMEVPLMLRTIIVNGNLDTFEVVRDDDQGHATLWWKHVPTNGAAPTLSRVTNACDADLPDIDIIPSGYGPIITVAKKVDKGQPPAFMRVLVKGYIYVAEPI
jgi:hypothetical protein